MPGATETHYRGDKNVKNIGAGARPNDVPVLLGGHVARRADHADDRVSKPPEALPRRTRCD
jgi:hypothetical protein